MKKYFPIAAILLFGLGLRLYNLTSISLWHDEAFSALLIKYPWGEMMTRIGLDVHPPMYYIFLRIWHYVFGDTLWSLRGFSVFFGLGTVWATWLFIKTAFKDQLGQKIALWTALLVAVSPFQLKYVTEARMYTMGAFFAVLAAYFLTKALREQKEYYENGRFNMPNMPAETRLRKNYWWHYLAFAICSGIIILTHYYLLFTAAALGFYGLLYAIFHYKSAVKRYVPLLTSYILILIFFLPWLKVFLFQYKQVQEGYWIEKMNAWSIPSTLWTMLLGIANDSTKSKTQVVLVLVTLFSLYILYKFLRKMDAFEKWLVAFCMLAPFAGAILFALLARLKGSNSSVYLERYFLYSSSFYLVLVAAWISQIKLKHVAVILLVGYSAFNLYAFSHYWSELKVHTKPGMNSAAKFLGANVEPDHKVYVGTSFEFFNYKYYNQTYYPTSVRPLLFTGGTEHAKDISHFAGSAILTDNDLVPNFAQAVKSGDTVWVIWTEAFGSHAPEVPKNWQKIMNTSNAEDSAFPDIRPYPGTVVYVTQYKVN